MNEREASEADPTRAREREFHAAFQTHFEAVMAYAIRRSPSRADAEDAVAEAFTAAWRRWDERPRSKELPWLYGICRRTLANSHRSATRREALAERATNVAREASDDDATSAVVRGAVVSAVRALPEADREVIFLTEWEGLSARDAAEALRCSVGAFHVRLFRARRRLRAELENQELNAVVVRPENAR